MPTKKKLNKKTNKAKKKGKKQESKKARQDKSAETKGWQPKIAVIGIGGGGCSVVSEIAKKITHKKLPHTNKIQFVAANVDLQAIKTTSRHVRPFHFGNNLTKGLGCGMDAELGKQVAEEAGKEIKKLVAKNDFCIFVSCMGGGTGSGATPIFAQIAHEAGVLSWGIFTQPFRFEGKERVQIAKNSLKEIAPSLSAFTIMQNQRIFKIIDEKTALQKSLSVMNDLLAETLEGFIETLYAPGLINLDFSDVKAILDNSHGPNKLAYLHSREFKGRDRTARTIQAVLKNPLVPYDIAGSDKMLFNIAGDKDMKMTEVEKISRDISAFNPRAKIIFGVLQNNLYKGRLRITLLATGCGQEQKKTAPKKPKAKPKDKAKTTIQKTEEIPVKGVEKTVEKNKERQKEQEKERERERQEEKIASQKTKKAPARKQQAKKRKKQNETSELFQKKTVRRNALDLHRQAQEDEDKMMEEEAKWDVPAFLREKRNS